jgi:hypothetical protein
LLGNKAITVVAVLALAGLLFMLFATQRGVGISPDSTVYLAAAQSLSRGLGLQVLSDGTGELVPLTHYPPLYPALLALTGAAGIALPSAARWLNAILFGANVGLVGLCVALYAREAFWLPVLASLVTLTAVDIAAVNSFALTEPLFMFLTLSGLVYLALYLEDHRRRFLIAAAFAIALSVLTRYVGVVSLITGGLVLLVVSVRSYSGHRGFRRRVLDALLFEAVSCLPVALWAMRNRLQTGGATERHFAFHPVKLDQLVAAFSTIAQWLLLGRVPANVRAIALLIEIVVLIVLCMILLRRRRDSGFENNGTASMLPLVLVTFTAVYLAFLVFTASFVDADTVFDNRSLVPIHFAGIILGLCLGWKLYARSASQSARTALVVFALLLLASQSFRGAGWVIKTSREAQGYASRAWTSSETVAAVRSLPPGISIYSNGQDAIFYLAGRRAVSIPEKVIHGAGLANQNYNTEAEKMKNDIRDRGAVLVYFRTLPERTYLPTEDELRLRLPSGVSAYADGLIFSSSK